MVAVDFVNGHQIISAEQDYNKARCSHVIKRGHTEVLTKLTKYSVSPITSNNHCRALMQGFFSLCHRDGTEMVPMYTT